MQRRSFWTRIRSGFIVATLCLGLTAVAGAAPFGYITDSFEDWVAVIDLANDTATVTVDVGMAPIGVAVTPGGTHVYVANRGSNNVSVIAAASNTVVATIPVGSVPQGEDDSLPEPQGLTVSPDGSKVYVAHGVTGYAFATYLSEIDTSTNTVTRELETVTGKSNQAFAVLTNPAGTRIYISNRFLNSISVVDAATFTLVTEIPVGANPRGMAITADGSKLLVANNNGNSVSVVSTASNSVTATIAMGTGIAPWAVAIHPNSSTAYVTNTISPDQAVDSVAVINLATNAITTTINVGNNPRGIEINSDGSRLYVVNYWSNTVSVISTATNSLLRTIDLPNITISGGLESIGLGPTPTGFLSVVNSLTFGDLRVDSLPLAQTVTVANRGTVALTLGTIAGSNPLAAPFSISEDSCSNSTLAANASCTFKVVFDPTAAVSYSDTFNVPSDAGTTTVSVSGRGLSATGNLPPAIPELLAPTMGQTRVAITPTFSWKEVTDPNGDAVIYRLYCSTSSDPRDATPVLALHIDESKTLYAGLGAGALALFGIGAVGNRRSRKKLALLASLLMLAGALVSACGGGGGSTPTSPDAAVVSATLNEPLTANTTYYWMVVADDGKDGGKTESAIRTFTTTP